MGLAKLDPPYFVRYATMPFPDHYRPRRLGQSLTELIVAMVASAFLLAGLGSVMLIARHIAYTPSAAVRRTQAADVVNQMADELRFATLISQPTESRVLEFVVADRNADGAAEKILYEWSGTVGDPLLKTIGGTQSPIIQNVQDCTFTFDSVAASTSPVVRTNLTRVSVQLRTGEAGHSRVDSAIPLVSQPERLIAYWRTDFDSDPTTIDVDADGSDDWVATGGATFAANADAVQSPGELSDGTWHANGDLATNPSNDFTAVTIVEARCRNMATSGAVDLMRINADRGAAYAALVVRMQRQLDGTQTLSLVGVPTTGSAVILPGDAGSMLLTSTVDNLTDDYVRFRLTVLPTQNKVNLQINDVDVGTYTYQTDGPASTDRSVKILGGGGAKFDYVEVRVLSN